MAVIGFTILNSAGHEEEILKFIREVCILDSDDVAKNIVAAGDYTNVYAKGLTEELLEAQPFDCSPIRTLLGSVVIVSNTNYILELPYNGGLIRLLPTEYKYILPTELLQFETPIRQRLLKVFGEGSDVGLPWILEENFWNDFGIWVDEDEWKD